MMTETTFSHDSDLEEAVIGACMIERAAMPLVADKLRPEMFYEEKNLEIFVALQSMYRSAKSIDTITLKNELAARGKLDAVGGPYELLRISSKVSSSAHLEYHALILRQLHTRRIMRTGFQQLLAFSADESMDIDDILVEAHRLLEGLEDESGVADHLRSIDRLMDDTLAEVEQRMEHGCNGITGIPTGFDALDHVTAGWQRGDLNILAARPSVGKTPLPPPGPCRCHGGASCGGLQPRNARRAPGRPLAACSYGGGRPATPAQRPAHTRRGEAGA